MRRELTSTRPDLLIGEVAEGLDDLRRPEAELPYTPIINAA